MPAKRPEGSSYALPRGAAHAAAAGWLLCAAGLILCAAPCVGRAAAAPTSQAAESGGKSAAASASKSVATTSASKPAAAASASKPAAAAPTRLAAGSESTPENPRTTRDSTFGAGEAGAAGASPKASASSAAKGTQRATTGGPASAQAARPAHANAAASATPAGTTPARLAASSVGRTHGVQTVAHLDQKLTYQYNALGRRDPFQPMVGGEFVGADVGGDAPVDVGGMKVVGIVWGTEDKFAMVEDGRGQSLVLRQGDKVMNGVVEGLRRDAVVVRITADGQTQSVAIPLTRKGDKSNATR